jgi:hypothetical protein
MRKHKTLMLAAGLLAATILPNWAQSASYTVTEASDDGTGVVNSLSWAINQANGTTEDDTITLQSDITLSAALPQITSTITIEGGEHFIDGNNNSNVGSVLQVESTGTLTLNNATVTGGTGTLNDLGTQVGGGGISSFGTVTLNSVTVRGNSAGDGTRDGFGGGLNNRNGTMTLNNTTVTGNTSSYVGAGVYNQTDPSSEVEAMLILVNSTVSDNTSDVIGGGIANKEGTVTLTNCTVSGNTAVVAGGGISNNTGSLLLNNCTVSNNNGGGLSGGIANGYTGTATITDSTIIGNTAGSAGGIGNDTQSTVTLTGTAVIGNTAVLGGGGIGVQNSGSLVSLTNCTVSGNTVTGDATNGTPGAGGGIGNDSATVIMNGVTVSDNTVPFGVGGGIAIVGTGTAELKTSLVSGNTAGIVALGYEVYSENTNTITADSHNFFGNSNQITADAFYNFTPGATDVNASSDSTASADLAAILSPLADNGGPTQTHALPKDSPAINLDAACTSGLTEDQRGKHRPAGPGCDAGAYEYHQTNMAPIYKLLLK